jgi:hypothetical protein
MANPQLQLNHPTSLTKRGLSPEETKEIVSSKADQIFRVLLAGQDADLNRIRDREEVVSQCISYSITADGYMDERRCSPPIWQDLGIIPAPMGNDNGRHPGPQKVIDENRFPGYLLHLEHVRRNSQTVLWNLLDMWNLLGEGIDVGDNDFLVRNGQPLSGREVCNELDRITSTLVGWHIQGFINNLAPQQPAQLVTMIRNCFTHTISRIALAQLHPYDICNYPLGYTRWKHHLNLVASFATLTIALDFFGGRNVIPENIVPLQF